MKKIFKYIFVVTIFSGAYANLSTLKMSAQPENIAPITYQTFYDELSPYGDWIEYPGYQHVWSPRVDGDFRPYFTNGNWEYTDDGWGWASDYDWGWAPFHYGRWLYEPQYGWLWIPGYEWSPAWVTWGEVDDYYAWAPLYPGVNVGYAYEDWMPNSIYWNIVPREHIYDRDLDRWAENREQDEIFVNRIHTLNNFNKTPLHNHYYSRGPEMKEVEKYTNRKIVPVSFKAVDRIMPSKREGNTIQVYRPNLLQPQPAVFKRITQETAPKQIREEQRINSNEKVNARENMNVKNSESVEKVTQRQNQEEDRSTSLEKASRVQGREEERMPNVEHTFQRQNIERMPQMQSPPSSFERRMPSGSPMMRKN